MWDYEEALQTRRENPDHSATHIMRRETLSLVELTSIARENMKPGNNCYPYGDRQLELLGKLTIRASEDVEFSSGAPSKCRKF